MLEKEDHLRAQDLYRKNRKEQFTAEERRFLIRYITEQKNEYRIRYCIYKKHSYINCYIQFTIDQMACSPRRSAVENAYTVICTRPISEIEIEELAENWGCHTRRFITWNYRNIEDLVEEDLKYNIKTPQKFIDECRRRGYTTKQK